MRFTFRLWISLVVVLVAQASVSQTNRVKFNNQALFLSGANLAWVNFAGDIGPGVTDFNRFADVMLSMHDHGGNVLRWWLHTNGTVTPAFNDSGYYVGPGAGTIADIRKVLDLAWEREVGVKLCLWSFDMLRASSNSTVLNRNRLLLSDTTYTRAYINNCLIPMVDSLKGHPAIIAWEIFNEPEGMSNEFGWSDIQHVPMAYIQRFVNLCAGAIHRTDTSALVTNGAWSFKALTDVPVSALAKGTADRSQLTGADKQQIAAQLKEKYRLSLTPEEILLHLQHVASVANFNYYSDNRLVASGGDPDGTLDFFSVHYYTGIDPSNPTSISPFHHPANAWGLTKPIVVAEFAMQNTLGVLKQNLFDTLYQTGYAGALAWSWTDVQFSTAEDMLAAMQSMWDRHQDAVDVLGISGAWPTVTITSPAADTKFPDSAVVAITADASDTDGSVVSVEFFVSDTVKIGQANAPPYTMIWKNILPGLYTLTAVAIDNDGHKRTSNRVPIRVGTPAMVRLEAEGAPRTGSGWTIRNDPTASNRYYVDFATNDTTVKITWTVPNVPSAGSYGIAFGYKLYYATPKTQYINVNGVRVGPLEFTAASSTTWYEKGMTLNLLKGSNTVQMQMFWGWMYVDYLAVPSSFVTAIAGEMVGEPARYALEQNYPNPFNPTTVLEYTIGGISGRGSGISSVRLVVYDLLGREVATLVNERKEPGTYQVIFDATGLASGVYLYRIQAGNFVETHKMILVR